MLRLTVIICVALGAALAKPRLVRPVNSHRQFASDVSEGTDPRRNGRDDRDSHMTPGAGGDDPTTIPLLSKYSPGTGPDRRSSGSQTLRLETLYMGAAPSESKTNIAASSERMVAAHLPKWSYGIPGYEEVEK